MDYGNSGSSAAPIFSKVGFEEVGTAPLFSGRKFVIYRGVAQLASALALGARGPGFKSLLPDFSKCQDH